MRRRNRGPSRATLYVMIVVGVIALAVLVQFAVHTVRTDPRDSKAIALRELQVNTLEPSERVLRMMPAPLAERSRLNRPCALITRCHGTFVPVGSALKA